MFNLDVSWQNILPTDGAIGAVSCIDRRERCYYAGRLGIASQSPTAKRSCVSSKPIIWLTYQAEMTAELESGSATIFNDPETVIVDSHDGNIYTSPSQG